MEREKRSQVKDSGREVNAVYRNSLIINSNKSGYIYKIGKQPDTEVLKWL